MQARVHAHEARAQVPVDHGANQLAGGGRDASFLGNVHDGGLVGVVDGGGNGTAISAYDLEHTPVARLPAGRRVEDGAVEHDAAARVDGEHARLTVAKVGVGAIELFGHDGRSWVGGTVGLGGGADGRE